LLLQVKEFRLPLRVRVHGETRRTELGKRHPKAAARTARAGPAAAPRAGTRLERILIDYRRQYRGNAHDRSPQKVKTRLQSH
jgi:hypothetical protein